MGYSIGEVSRRLGVPVPTLRSWHRRYGIALPERTEGGHRRYTERDLRLLQALNEAVTRGVAPRVAVRAIGGPADAAAPLALLERLLAAADAGDQPGFCAVLDEAAALGMDVAVDQLLIPALSEIGRRWEVKLIDVGVEHLATAAARSWIARQSARATRIDGGPAVLLAAGPGNQHTVALEAFGLLLQRRGCATRLLGADTPVEVLVRTSQRTNACAAVITAHLATRRSGAVEGLRLLTDAGLPVFYAGAAFDAPRRRQDVPGRYLGTCLADAATLVQQAV